MSGHEAVAFARHPRRVRLREGEGVLRSPGLAAGHGRRGDRVLPGQRRRPRAVGARQARRRHGHSRRRQHALERRRAGAQRRLQRRGRPRRRGGALPRRGGHARAGEDLLRRLCGRLSRSRRPRVGGRAQPRFRAGRRRQRDPALASGALQGEILDVDSLTKRYGATTAVDDLSFQVQPGAVTGFLGPNGAGKTTTLRILLGLVRPTSGRATIGGAPYAARAEPTRMVGAVLEQGRFHPGRWGRDHLRVVTRATGVGESRVDEVLELVDLTGAARRRVKGYSLGMRQRLDIATALLGDPGVLILDEPANGLDPEGVRWLRDLLRERARAGGTVLLSSHVLAEVELLADRVVVIAGGRLRAQGTVAELVGESSEILARTPSPGQLVAALAARGLAARADGGDRVLVAGATTDAVGDAAHGAGLALHELARRDGSLEDVFLRLTEGA